MKILMIDNYDSFTYNLAQYIGEQDADLTVARNDRITLPEIREMAPDGIVISPGPGTPDDAGITLSLIREFLDVYPILGVCLGHQSIAQALGGGVIPATELMHGKTSRITHSGTDLFEGIPNPMTATRYHSLMVKEASLPEELIVTARSEDGTIMALAHRQHPVVGVQFHPESFLTEGGKRLVQNFLNLYTRYPRFA